ncbi:hypothetical protein MKK75_22535 [Methylobacterium sp. J-030]|uniref:hypothetical protein n=1 Tax=Methylobacterium sp. J-030 TaxID=2836627 RepID=UPI001FBB6784|nr:hypothetical protein [Methylobacterium sp. J-030]MCJ2071542.1 hypothetical protein [Methylobacterium sp. J-030]
MSCRPASPRRCLARWAMLSLMTLAGLATVPSEGADAQLERPKSRMQMPAAERWSLRPAEPLTPSTTGSIRGRVEAAIPESRRHVRFVYPALIEAR